MIHAHIIEQFYCLTVLHAYSVFKRIFMLAISNQMKGVYSYILEHPYPVVPSAPPSPPSVSKHIEDGMKKMNILQSIAALLKNINFVVFLIIFGECISSKFPAWLLLYIK